MDIPNSGAIFTLGKSYLAENTQSYFYIKNDPIKRLVSGPQQSAVICESGRLFVWGENHYGQLGVGAAHNAKSVNHNNNTNNTKNSNESGEPNGDIITKPTCVKSLKTLGLKIADIAYGTNWSAILTYSNEIFFSGRSIFDSTADVSQNFSETTISNDKCAIIRKPFRLEEFDDCLSTNEEAENFITILAGNEHFAVMTSFGRLIGWGSNRSRQLGITNTNNSNNNNNNNTDDAILLRPQEIKLDAPVRQFACGPESTLVLTESGNLFLTGRLNDLVFPEFVILQKNLSAAEQIIFMHISKASEIFIVTNAGSIYRSTESVRNKSLIFQRFYDYDSEEHGPIWKLLKGSSFYAVLTKANKFFTTFSESGHHLKTFREISKFKNLRLLDLAVGDQHILVHGIPRSSTLSATMGPGGEHRFMSRSFVMPIAPNALINGHGNVNNNENGISSVMRKSNNQPDLNQNTKEIPQNDLERKETAKPEPSPGSKNEIAAPVESEIDHPKTAEKEFVPKAEEEQEEKEEEEEEALSVSDEKTNILKNSIFTKADVTKSPAESRKSIRFEPAALEKTASSDRLLRPRTPYPESSTGSTPQTIKKTPLRNYSYEAAMANDYLDHTSPPPLENLENIPENLNGESSSKAIATIITSSPTPPHEEDEQLTVEINTITDALDSTVVVNEIRFINNGVDVTANVKQNTTETESEDDALDDDDDDDDGDDHDDNNDKGKEGNSLKESKVVESIQKKFNEKTEEARKQAEGMLNKLEHEIVEKVDKAAEMKTAVKETTAETINEIESKLEDAGDAVKTTTKNVARETMDAVGANVKRVANDARQAVENIGHGAMKVAGDARQAVDSALTKVASETKQAVGVVTTKISNEMNEAKDSLSTMLQPSKASARRDGNNDNDNDNGNDDDEQSSSNDAGTFKESGIDDERTTASVNSNKTSSAGGGNPFENTNPFESNNNPFENSNPFENDYEDNLRKGQEVLRNEINNTEHQIAEHSKGRMRQFLDDVRAKSKGISCRNEKSINIDDELPRYTSSDNINSVHTQNGNARGEASNQQNTSKVCIIL